MVCKGRFPDIDPALIIHIVEKPDRRGPNTSVHILSLYINPEPKKP